MLAAAAISAACGGGSGDVTGPPGGAGTVDSLVLSLDSIDVIVGDTLRISAEARDAEGRIVPGVPLSYTSSDPSVATVSDDGLVTSIDLGVADITVAIAGEASSRADSPGPSYAAVLAPGQSRARIISMPRVVITPGEQTLDPNATSQYSARLTNTRGADLAGRREWTWSSTDPSVARIDATGLVTAVKEGDTRIAVNVKVGRLFRESGRVPLHVAWCHGIFGVSEWFATGDVEFGANGFVAAAQSTYSIYHVSTGTAQLKRVPGTDPADSMVWEGAVTGTVELDNSLSFPVPPPLNTGITTEKRNGDIEPGLTARARLIVRKPAEPGRGCTYDFHYGDWFTWLITNNQGAPPIPKTGPTGSARVIGQQVGAPLPSGHLALGNLDVGTALPARAFVDPVRKSDYTVGSTLGVSMIIALGGAAATYGQASFIHFITGRPQ
jgi:hypothetical protein